MANLSRVPVVDITKDNLREVWPSLMLAMSSSSYIAIDTVCMSIFFFLCNVISFLYACINPLLHRYSF